MTRKPAALCKPLDVATYGKFEDNNRVSSSINSRYITKEASTVLLGSGSGFKIQHQNSEEQHLLPCWIAISRPAA